MLKTCWFLLMFLTRQSSNVPHQTVWTCGGVRIADDNQCKCGSDVWTMEDHMRQQCCGPDTCSIDDNGDATCPDGVTCNTSSKSRPWNCGNIMIAQEKTCQCGSSSPPLDWRLYYYDTWCCPSEPCTYQEDGTAVCHNATIV